MLADNRGRRTCAGTVGRPDSAHRRAQAAEGAAAQRQRREPVHRHRPVSGLQRGRPGAGPARPGLGRGCCALVAGTAQELGPLGLHGGLDQ